MKTENLNEKRIALLEKKLSSICQEIYELGARQLTPIHPYVLVRVLPKEHITEGGIILAETAQNKIIYEGVVLAVWKSYNEFRTKNYEGPPSMTETITIHHRSDLSVGDRVAFPHYEGVPVGEWLDDRYYRLIREGADQNKTPYCSVFGKLDYSGDKEVSRKIRALTKTIGSITTSGVSMSRGADR